MSVQQHILRLDVAVHEALVMGVLQGGGHLADIAHDALKRQAGACRMARAQGAAGGILHHQKGDALMHREVQHAHNMGVRKAGQGPRLGHEARCLLLTEPCVQDFDRRPVLEVQVFPEIHLGKAAPAQQTQQVVVAQLLSNMISHA